MSINILNDLIFIVFCFFADQYYISLFLLWIYVVDGAAILYLVLPVCLAACPPVLASYCFCLKSVTIAVLPQNYPDVLNIFSRACALYTGKNIVAGFYVNCHRQTQPNTGGSDQYHIMGHTTTPLGKLCVVDCITFGDITCLVTTYEA